jgi:hypothetical protein
VLFVFAASSSHEERNEIIRQNIEVLKLSDNKLNNIKPNMGHEGRTVNVLEIQSALFRLDAWKCYWELNDLEYPSGWTYDFMPSYCFEQERVKENKLQGVMNNQVMVHES